MSDTPQRWMTERLHEGYLTAYRADKVYYEEGTGQWNLVIYENARFGRMMSLDGVTQVTERDEFIYHEMMAHVPILAHGKAKNVLIIGGGDGGMLHQVTRHKGIEKITMVEIDKGVVDFAKTHLGVICRNAFDDPRLDLVIADGSLFVKKPPLKYDVIIVDSTDPIGPGAVLFTQEFYRDVKGCLAEGGVVITQNGVPFMQADELRSTMEKFRKLFTVATCYLATVPTYVGGPMAMGFGTNDESLLSVPLETLEARFAVAGFATKYYTPEVHKAAFAHPVYVKEIVAGA
ncbi:MAG: polyamine aminopropyltransferase [Parvibaculaceae bacterium]|nr:polyamine aminopropyltransferase [Parvibaculaceae bacterium]